MTTSSAAPPLRSWIVCVPALLLAVAAPSAASAHSWYPLACCSGIDCAQAAPGEVEVTSDGWLVVPTGEVIPFGKERGESPDGRFHRCVSDPGNRTSRTRCLFVPGTGA